MNKKRMWLVAISVATMITANGVVLAAAPTDKQDNAPGMCRQMQPPPGEFGKDGYRGHGFHADQQALLAFLKIDRQTYMDSVKAGKTLSAIAQEQGISEQELTDFMVKQITTRLEQAAKEGRVPADRPMPSAEDIAKQVAEMINGKAPLHAGHGPMMHGLMRPAPFDESKLLALLNLDKDSLHDQLRSGKTLADIAKSQDVSEKKLKKFLTSQMTERLNEDVKAGRIPEAQAATMKAGLEKHVDAMIHGHHPMHPALFDDARLLSLLNLDKASFMNELRAGKSLAAIAQERNVSEQALKQTLLEEMTQHLEQAVKDGRMPAEKAEKIKAHMEERVSGLINGKLPLQPCPPSDNRQ